jgi:hypothetical protein
MHTLQMTDVTQKDFVWNADTLVRKIFEKNSNVLKLNSS